ncbi:MAG: hypothetical protein N2039_01125 [Gemmataceae bacterium]|nr:hypothetical protein [Gemmataceae bacterium]
MRGVRGTTPGDVLGAVDTLARSACQEISAEKIRFQLEDFPLARREEIELNLARRWTGTRRQPRPAGTGHREEVPMNGFIAWGGTALPPRSRFTHVSQLDGRIPRRDRLDTR